MLLAAGAAVIAVIAIAAVVLLAGDDGPTTLDTARAADRVAEVVDAAAPDAADSSKPLDDCDAGDLEKMGESIPDEFDTSAVSGRTEVEVVFVSPRDPAQIQCHIGDEQGYGLVVSESPADLETYLTAVLGEDLDFEKASTLRGGEVLSVCSTATGTPAACATAWADSRLMVVMVVSGDGASSKVTSAWLERELSGVVQTLASATKATI